MELRFYTISLGIFYRRKIFARQDKNVIIFLYVLCVKIMEEKRNVLVEKGELNMTRRSKRIISILLSIMCLLTLLSGCGKETKQEEKKTVYKKTEVIITNGVVPTKAAFNGNIVYYVSGDEVSEKLSTYDMEKKEENELPIAISEDEMVLAIHCLDSGELIVLTGKGEGTFYLAGYGTDNKELWKNEITDKLYEKDMEAVFSLETDKDGNIYLRNGLCLVVVWDKAGNFQFKLRSDDYMQGIVRIKDKVYVYCTKDKQYVLQEIDVKKQKWKETKQDKLPQSYSVIEKSVMEQKEGSLLVYTQTGILSYNMKTGNSEKVFDWARYGLTAEEIYTGSVQGENVHFLVAAENDLKLAIFSPAKEGEIPEEKEVITINPEADQDFIKDAVLKFNEQSDKYVVEFAEEFSGNAYNRDMLRDVEVMAGKGTDIMYVNAEQYRKYSDKGILEDLYTYMDADEDTRREDYIPNVCKMYEEDGKLFAIPPSFVINTIATPTKYVGEKTHFTLEEFQEFAKNLPEGKKLSWELYNTRMSFIILLRFTYPHFIDFENATCNFDSEEFISWLKFINSIEPIDPDSDDFDITKINPEEYVLSGSGGSITSVREYQYQRLGFGEEVTFIGFPGKDSSGSFVHSGGAIGIWSQSKHKEGAWEFIKFMLSEEMQDTLSGYEFECAFPIRISSLEKEYAKAMEVEYETDENGNQVEKPSGERMIWHGKEVPYYAATEEDIAKMRELIASLNTAREIDDTIEIIVLEEVEAFYNGDKSAEEVAGYIQNRVQTYLNEKK